jgi:hypothetical protein
MSAKKHILKLVCSEDFIPQKLKRNQVLATSFITVILPDAISVFTWSYYGELSTALTAANRQIELINLHPIHCPHPAKIRRNIPPN